MAKKKIEEAPAPDPLDTTAFRDLAAQQRAEALKPLAETKAALRALAARVGEAVADLEKQEAEHGRRIRALRDGTDFRLLSTYLPANEVNRYERLLDDTVELASRAPGALRELNHRIADLTAEELNGPAVNTIKLELRWITDYPLAYREHVRDIRAITKNFEERLDRKRQRGEGPNEKIIDVAFPEPKPQVQVETDFNIFEVN